MLRFLLWRMLALFSAALGVALLLAILDGYPGRQLRGHGGHGLHLGLSGVAGALARLAGVAATALPSWAIELAGALAVAGCALAALSCALRLRARRDRVYVRLRVLAYRTDTAEAPAVSRMFAAMHAAVAARWWRRLCWGQPSLAVEVHYEPGEGGNSQAWLSVCCPADRVGILESALRAAYPNARLSAEHRSPGVPPAVLRLRKHSGFIRRIGTAERFDRDRDPPIERVITTMAAVGAPCYLQLALTPAPASLETLARWLFKRHEARLARARREHFVTLDRSMVDEAELRGGLEVQHRSLFFADVRVVADRREQCERIASVLRVPRAENRLVERGTALRQGVFGLYTRRIRRGEGNPLAGIWHRVLAPAELAELWQLPSVDYATVPISRSGLPLAPAPPEVFRPGEGRGTLRDALGDVSIHRELRRQNTAVPGTVEQGKSSYLVATVAEDLRRDRCAVIVMDPKGDAADAAISAVPPGRTCTLLDFADPTCGFNPLAIDAPADVIADYVVAALKLLFTDSDIRASSDRYLRNAIIAVLAHDRQCTLWDAARLLSVGEEGYDYRRAVGARVRELPELKEISQFFTAELTAQLADARSMTTSKLDAPVNKLARLLNSPSIKRVLLNESLRIDLDRVIANGEVLVVKGALGAMGAGNTSVLMQLLIGMLDAALARQQDLVSAEHRTAVALKIDEAPLVLNRGFAETMALKRSAGLETVACWQTDAQWVDRQVRDQLDALFAHRVYFATASALDARQGVALTMAEFSDTVRPGIARLSALGRPDVRLRLPRYHAIASWSTPQGRQAGFIAETIPLTVDHERLALHAAEQRRRGGRRLTDLQQSHWEGVAGSVERGEENGTPPRPDEASTSTRRPRSSSPAPPRGERMTAPADRVPIPPPMPARPADSYSELRDLDRAQAARAAPAGEPPGRFEPDALDLEILVLLARLGHLLSSQIHRRFNPGRAATTTQRRLKRLSDAGLVERFQFHRPDGGGVPMCYRISSHGWLTLEARGQPVEAQEIMRGVPGADSTNAADGHRLGQVRRQIHVSGWVLALSELMPGSELRGAGASVLLPPRTGIGGARPLGPGDLKLPAGRVAHDFLRSLASGERVEVNRFDTLRPDATVVLPGRGGEETTDVIVELDDRINAQGWTGKLERYDHFLTGWALHTVRYGRGATRSPLVLFICRDRSRASECARRADGVLCACRAYAGDHPHNWEHPARARMFFVAERDVHERSLWGWGVPPLPPPLRLAEAGKTAWGEATAVGLELPLRHAVG